MAFQRGKHLVWGAWFGRLRDWVGVGKMIIVAPSDGVASLASDALRGESRCLVCDNLEIGEPTGLPRPTGKEAVMGASSTPRPGARNQTRVHIRWMIRRDMAEVLDIERRSFEFPWFEEDFIRCLRQRNCIGMVAEHGDRVVGFMIYELHKTRLHILNFAVADDVRRSGVGEQMIAKLIGKLSSQRRTRITLEVRETNLPAQLFFKSAGFRATTVLRAYYEDSPEDAYLMQYRRPADEDEPTILPINRIDRLAG